MTLQEIEKEMVKFCELNGIPIVRGKIAPDRVEEVKRFLVTLKRKYKIKRAFEKRQPKSIKQIKIL